MIKLLRDTLGVLTAQERKRFVWLTVTDSCLQLLDIIFLAALLLLVQLYTGDPGNLPFYWLRQWATEKSLIPLGIFTTLFCIKNIIAWKFLQYQHLFSYAVAARLAKLKLDEYLHGAYHQFSQTDAAVHRHAIGQEPVEFAHYVLGSFQQVLTQALQVFFALIAIAWYNAGILGWLVLLMGVPLAAVGWGMKNRLRKLTVTNKRNSEKSGQYLQEALAGFVESNVYERNDFFSDRYFKAQAALNTGLAARLSLQFLPARLMEIFAVLGFFFLIWLQQSSSNNSIENLVTIGAFLLAAYKIIPGMVKMLNAMGQVKAYSYTISTLKQIKKHETEQSPVGNISKIELKDVSFSFEEKVILPVFSETFQRGDFILISGDSGKGKSTLVNLLLGFHEPRTGRILMNDIECNASERRRFCKRIAYTKQQPFVISDNILNNIKLHDNGFDETVIVERAALAGLTQGNDIDILMQPVTEQGRNISGGQRQRVAFARALYKEADVIILDEPFSELDNLAEREMLLHLQQLAKSGKIVLLISHQQQAQQFCNRHIQLDHD